MGGSRFFAFQILFHLLEKERQTFRLPILSADRLDRVHSEEAVALQLRFAKPLVGRWLMWKFRVRGGIIGDVGRFIARQHRLDVNEYSVGLRSIDLRVSDRAEGTAMNRAFRFLWRHDFDVDRDAQIDPDFADGVPEILKDIIKILPGIDHEDEFAAAQHHFVEAEIVEVSAIRKIDVLVAISRVPDRLGKERPDCVERPAAFPGPRSGCAWIAQPPTEAHVEERHQETNDG